MPQIFKHKLYLIPLTVFVLAVVIIFGFTTRANNDLKLGGTLWTQGLSSWSNLISVAPGQTFKISLYATNFSSTQETFTNLNISDQLPQYTSYIAGSAFQINDTATAWQAYSDNGATSPFIGGVSATPDGTLVPAQLANFKYSVKVADFLPNGTTQLSWAGPILHFNDANGAQTNTNVESNTINIQNLPNIQSFTASPSQPKYKLGDVINFTITGTVGKAAKVEIGTTVVPLVGNGTYTGTYTVQSGDSFVDVTSRAYLINTNNTGAYLDGNNITIDGIIPPAPTGLTATLNGDLTVTLNWAAPASISDVAQYAIYSATGTNSLNFNAAPLAQVTVGTNQFTTAVLANDVLYKFAVRAIDAAGNSDANTTVVTKSTDVTPPEPPASLVQPTSLNQRVLKFNVATPLQFVWASSPATDLVRYRLEIDDNSDFSSIITSQETTGTTTSYSLTTAIAALPEGLYVWRVSAIDDAELVSAPTITPDNSFEIDNTAPTLAVTQSASGGHIGGNFTVAGTAADSGSHLGGSNGLQKVEVFLSNFLTGQYWDGTAWVGGSVFITATTTDNFASWSYLFTAPITNNAFYITGARATDKVGFQTDSSLINLVGDTVVPTAASVTLTNTTLSSTVIFKNGDNIVLTATITDNLGQSGMTTANITANLSAITGNPGDNAVQPATYNTGTGVATWAAVTAAGAGDGLKTVAVTASDLAGNTGNGSSSILADNTVPAITAATLTSPTGTGINWAGASVQNITWNQAQITDANLATNPITLEYTTDGTNYTNIASSEANDGTYAWTVPSLNSQTVKVRITTKDNAGNASNDVSNNDFTIDSIVPAVSAVTLTNTTLSSTVIFKNGDNIVLTATITDNLGQSGMTTANITANLSAITGNPGDNAVQPATYNTGTGVATWAAVTAAGAGDGLKTVAVTASDLAGNTGNGSSSILADNTVPAITAATLTSPTGTGINWAGASVQNITWNQAQITDANLATNPITLEYTTDGTNYTNIASSEANDGTFSWTLPSINSQTMKVRVTARDNVNNTANDISDNNFTIDSTAPTVGAAVLTAPNGNEAWKQGTVKNITWNSGAVTDNFGLASNPITLEYTTDGATWNSIATNEANDGIFSWTTPLVDSTTVKVRLTATDAAGLTASDQSDNNFSIGLPPVIVQARAMSNTLIEVEWDKALSSAGAFGNYTATGITATAAAVSGGNNKIVNLTVNALNNTGFIAADLSVALNIVTDTSNFQNEAASGVSIVDKQAPQFNLAGSYPNSNQLIVDFSPAMRLAVSEAYGSTTVFKLDNIAQTTSYDATNKLITFTPGSALVSGKHTLSLDLVDMASNSIPNQTWDFYIDNFGINIVSAPVAFSFNGNTFDDGSGAEQQSLTISTFGAGYKIYAVFSPAVSDGFGNFMNDMDIKRSTDPWTNKIDLNGTTQVQLVSVAKAGTPSASVVNTTYTFDLRATIPGVLQAAGNYQGTLQFIVVPEY